LQEILDAPPLASSQQSFFVAPGSNFVKPTKTSNQFDGQNQGSIHSQKGLANNNQAFDDQAFLAPQSPKVSNTLVQIDPVFQTTPSTLGFRAPRKLQVDQVHSIS